ncbi:MAG: cysteine peptidase family C39 domain-containing protein [Janthinobacterium lividum]
MKPFPHYQQHDQMDCGPACLRMVARHYGRHFTAQSLRERAELSREGVSLLGLAEAAEAIGFRSLGVQVPFEKLMREAQLPCIVHWQQNTLWWFALAKSIEVLGEQDFPASSKRRSVKTNAHLSEK